MWYFAWLLRLPLALNAMWVELREGDEGRLASLPDPGSGANSDSG
jgi:cyd operon protein YbgT